PRARRRRLPSAAGRAAMARALARQAADRLMPADRADYAAARTRAGRIEAVLVRCNTVYHEFAPQEPNGPWRSHFGPIRRSSFTHSRHTMLAGLSPDRTRLRNARQQSFSSVRTLGTNRLRVVGIA